jgi:hypothetical protein
MLLHLCRADRSKVQVPGNNMVNRELAATNIACGRDQSDNQVARAIGCQGNPLHLSGIPDIRPGDRIVGLLVSVG